ncbi:MAG TPA: GNAT family protein [Solirubrobacterales bacterium]|nr:GNAT family protein [Solirubrobacterales bacterium]
MGAPATDGARPADGAPRVRPMRLDEVGFRIDYFHDASDEYLRKLGVERALLPRRADWLAYYEEDFARPLAERETYNLAWELDGRLVGFSSTDHIEFGEQAFMHLHIVEAPRRRRGLGTEFVRRSVEEYFRALALKRLFCQPNAYNAAPNRTLQRAGFRYVFSAEMEPSTINFVQPITRWVIERDALPLPRPDGAGTGAAS